MPSAEEDTLLGTPGELDATHVAAGHRPPAAGEDATLHAAVGDAPADHQREPGHPVSPGDRVGRYEVLDTIGAGGMGAVYLARDPELGREVAVKVVRRQRSGTAGEAEQARLQREAQAMAAVSHPNLATVFDVGRRDDEVFIAMEYIRGSTLREWARGRDWREVIEAYTAAGRGLAAAHQAGIVHRDFKPDNVLVGAHGKVKVLDFGLAAGAIGPAAPPAAVADDRDPASLKLTQTGAVMGTPAYMSPEQFEGTQADGRSDQFSFAVALYEGLYGHRPFRGDSFAALARAVLAGELVEPPRGEVPRGIDHVLRRALARRPEDRYPDMDALLAALALPEAEARPPLPRGPLVGGAVLLAGLGLWAAMSASREPPPGPPDPPPPETAADGAELEPDMDPAEGAAERALLEVLLAPDEEEKVHRAIAYLETHGESGGPARAAIAHGVVADVRWRQSCAQPVYDLCLDVLPAPADGRCRVPTMGPVRPRPREAAALEQATSSYASVLELAGASPPTEATSAARFHDTIAVARLRMADTQLESYLADEVSPEDRGGAERCGDDDCLREAAAAFVDRKAAPREALLARYAQVAGGESSYGQAVALARQGLVWEGVSEAVYRELGPNVTAKKGMEICGDVDESGVLEAREAAQAAFMACSQKATELGLSSSIIGLCDARSSALAKLDKVGIRETIRANHELVRACATEHAARTGEAATGRVVVRFAIGPGGSVTASAATEDSTAPRELGTCVAAKIKGLEFPDPGATLFVNYPFNFTPPKASPDGADDPATPPPR